MFEPAVDGLGGSVAGAGSVEVGQHVDGPLVERAAQGDQARSAASAPRGSAHRSARPSARGRGLGRVAR